MSLLEEIKERLGEKKPVRIYCSNCNQEITNRGGFIDESGMLVCQERASDLAYKGERIGEYLSPKKLQEYVRQGRIKLTGRMEKLSF
jgi:hypothetical protein